jgi:hypothetical protein
MSKSHLHIPHVGHQGHPPDDDEEPPGHKKSPWPGRLEILITVMLGLAAITGAYAAFKNEQRNHNATENFSQGIRNFDDSGQYYATYNAEFTHNQALFLEYAKAIQQNNKDLVSYIYNNLMDMALQKAVKWWQSPANTSSAHPVQTPFTSQNPDYVTPQFYAAQQSATASQKNFKEAKTEQDKADHYTLIEVILATALFLYGIAGVTRNMMVKLGTLGMGLAIYVVSLALLVTG